MTVAKLTNINAYPCEPCSGRELSEAALRAVNGSQSDLQLLQRATYRIPIGDVRWLYINTLCILGNRSDADNESLSSIKMSAGAYINSEGDCLICVRPRAYQSLLYLNLCEKNLISLLLCDTAITKLSLSEMSLLEELTIEAEEELGEISGMDRVYNLKTLTVRNCSRIRSLPELDGLTKLVCLNLSGCFNLVNIPSVENLPQLRILNLSGCRLMRHSIWLNNLRQLTELDLSGSDVNIQQQGIEHLKLLVTLNLSGCARLSQLTGLENLTQLRKLDISACKMLTRIEGLDQLEQLTELNLSECVFIDDLPSLERLSRLKVLNLAGCRRLERITGLENLTCLNFLNLSGCTGMEDLPAELCNLKDLRLLDLSYMRLRTMPDWLMQIAERITLTENRGIAGEEKAIVYLHGTTIESIPDLSIFEQSREMVEQWFHAKNKVTLNEVKVVFLGDGEAGKTHTIARLMNDGGDPDPAIFDGNSTPGVVIRHKEYDVDGRKIKINYWDFGGQEIMHSMHRIFLTGRTMYVILINARDDTQGDRAKYWLHNVQSFAPGAPVLLVLNKIDQNENASVDEVDLRERYDKLTRVVRLSAKKHSKEEFEKRLTKVLLEEIGKTGFLDAQWPESWMSVKRELENLEDNYIMGDKYEDICKASGVDRNRENLLNWFNDLGVSFCCCGENDFALRDYVILRPDWITNALYIILFNTLEGADNGIIPHRSIFNTLVNAYQNESIQCTMPEARYNGNAVQYVLNVMRRFSLSFDDRNGNEFIPMLCGQNSKVNVPNYSRDPRVLEFVMGFDYLPNNLIHRLMVDRRTDLDIENVWRTGARFRSEETGLSAVVAIDGNDLRILIRSDNSMNRPNTYLTMLKADVDRIVKKMGLKPPVCSLICKLNGKREEFDYDMLKEMQEAGETKVFSRSVRGMIPIADILNQSAPDVPDAEIEFLNKLQDACQQLQAERCFRLIRNEDGKGYENGQDMEDFRNRRVRDALRNMGEDVSDQTQQGSSGSGRGPGELDMLIRDKKRHPWTIVEALRVSDGSKTTWNEHLNKLIGNYDVFGLPRLYLLTYVDADPEKFKKIWDGYRDHIKAYDPGRYTCQPDTFVDLELDSSCKFFKIARCRYDCGGEETTLYHIFARIPTQFE